MLLELLESKIFPKGAFCRQPVWWETASSVWHVPFGNQLRNELANKAHHRWAPRGPKWSPHQNSPGSGKLAVRPSQFCGSLKVADHTSFQIFSSCFVLIKGVFLSPQLSNCQSWIVSRFGNEQLYVKDIKRTIPTVILWKPKTAPVASWFSGGWRSSSSSAGGWAQWQGRQRGVPLTDAFPQGKVSMVITGLLPSDRHVTKPTTSMTMQKNSISLVHVLISFDVSWVTRILTSISAISKCKKIAANFE